MGGFLLVSVCTRAAFSFQSPSAFQFPMGNSGRTFRGLADGRGDMSTAARNDDLTSPPEMHANRAEFVVTTAGAVFVRHADVDVVDARRKPAKGEANAPRCGLSQVVWDGELPASNTDRVR
ncbi:MAG: hypothetical protein GX575_07520 [Candidatus Anammoximicrobium sp.]|nr:hypothetical protein [Candidatus Anammoximicrobium sp.]